MRCFLVLLLLLACALSHEVVQRSEKAGCKCIGTDCGCCDHIDWKVIHLNDTVCLNITYNPSELSISLTLSINTMTILNETVSAKNPDVCVAVPFLHKLASLCIDFVNLTYSQEQFSGCVDLEAKLLGISVEKVQLGCFDLHLLKKVPAHVFLEKPAVVLEKKAGQRPILQHLMVPPQPKRREKIMIA